MTQPGPAADPSLRDQIISLITAHAVGCQDTDCGWCDRAARIADDILEAVAEHYGDDPGGRHVIEFRADGWTIKHPLSCRPDLFACRVNRVGGAQLRVLDGPPVPPGRYACELNDAGDRFLIGDRLDQAKAADDV